MNDYTKLVLRETIEHQKLKPPWWKQAEFTQWCYKNWALKELYEITSSPETCPVILRIEDFVDQMNRYSCMNGVFSPAYDEAVYILDLCITEIEERRQL